jgi:hypothetical protein
MKPALAVDVALAVEFRKRAYLDREEGRDPLASYRQSVGAIAPEDAAAALDIAVDALLRATDGDLDRIIRALWLDNDLEAEADAFAAGLDAER